MKMKGWVRMTLNTVGDLSLIIIAGDLLYLFYKGAWGDPNSAIIIAEVSFLWFAIAFGLFRYFLHMKEAKEEREGQ